MIYDDMMIWWYIWWLILWQPPPRKTNDFLSLLLTFHSCSTRGIMLLYEKKASYIFFACLQRIIERWGRGGKGHRVSGDTAGSWFKKPATSLENSWWGYRRTTLIEACTLLFWPPHLSGLWPTQPIKEPRTNETDSMVKAMRDRMG